MDLGFFWLIALCVPHIPLDPLFTIFCCNFHSTHSTQFTPSPTVAAWHRIVTSQMMTGRTWPWVPCHQIVLKWISLQVDRKVRRNRRFGWWVRGHVYASTHYHASDSHFKINLCSLWSSFYGWVTTSYYSTRFSLCHTIVNRFRFSATAL